MQNATQPSAGSYRPDIDGLRAVAVLSVVLYHFGLGFPGGYVGVDVFFVISGFLITRVLCGATPSEGLLRYMLGFWLRRIRRLAPALAVTTLLTLVASYPFLGDVDRLHAAWTTLCQLGFSANFYLYSEAGYFGPDAESLLFLHHWSLAVEEQFYVVFPTVLLLLLQRGRRATLTVLSMVALASLALGVLATGPYPDFSFYLLPTRAWELLAGGLLAIGDPAPPASRPRREAIAWASIAAIGFAVFGYDHGTPFPGSAALAPCLGTVGLIYAGRGRNLLSDLLATRAFVWVGLISYSLYLVHWPISAMTFYTSFDEPTVTFRLLMLAASIGAAWISWKFVETPVRSRRLLKTTRGLLAGFLASSLVIASLCVAVIARVPSTPKDLIASAKLQDLKAGRLVGLGVERTESRETHLMLWGDSHAQVLGQELSDVLADAGLSGSAAISFAVPPLLGATLRDAGRQMPERSEAVLKIIGRDKPRHVLLAATWWAYAVDEDGDGQLLATGASAASTPSSLELFESALLETVHRLEAAGTQPWLLSSVPLQNQHIPRALLAASRDGRDLAAIGVTALEHRERQRQVDEVIERVANATTLRVLDPTPYLSLDNGHTRVEVDGAPAYRDTNHLDPRTGVPLIRPLLEQLVGR